jgi:hypothetical protein
MSNKILIDYDKFSSLAEELSNLGKSFLATSRKIETMLKIERKVKSVRVTPETDPDMFTKEFINSVKKARKEFREGKAMDYFEFRKTLDLE